MLRAQWPGRNRGGHSDFARRKFCTTLQVRVPRNGGSRGRAAWRREALPNRRLRPPPSVFWFLFHAEKELAPQGETLQNGAPRSWPRPASLAPAGQFTFSRPTNKTSSPPHPALRATFPPGGRLKRKRGEISLQKRRSPIRGQRSVQTNYSPSHRGSGSSVRPRR